MQDGIGCGELFGPDPVQFPPLSQGSPSTRNRLRWPASAPRNKAPLGDQATVFNQTAWERSGSGALHDSGRQAQSCAVIKSRSAWASVRKDREWALNLGLRLTPSIIIGNKLIQGVTSYSRLALIVRRELSDRNLAAPQRAARSQSGCGSALGAQGCSE